MDRDRRSAVGPDNHPCSTTTFTTSPVLSLLVAGCEVSEIEEGVELATHSQPGGLACRGARLWYLSSRSLLYGLWNYGDVFTQNKYSKLAEALDALSAFRSVSPHIDWCSQITPQRTHRLPARLPTSSPPFI